MYKLCKSHCSTSIEKSIIYYVNHFEYSKSQIKVNTSVIFISVL